MPAFVNLLGSGPESPQPDDGTSRCPSGSAPASDPFWRNAIPA